MSAREQAPPHEYAYDHRCVRITGSRGQDDPVHRQPPANRIELATYRECGLVVMVPSDRRYGEETRAYVCPRCGALIVDVYAHESWHDDQAMGPQDRRYE